MEKLVHLSSVQQILSTAAHVLGYDLQRMCLRGPQSSLDETVHCQPAVVVASLAAVEGLRETSPEVTMGVAMGVASPYHPVLYCIIFEL